MVEVHLGSVAVTSARHFSDVLGDPIVALQPGSYDVIGRVDARTKRIESAALTRNVGNDQWHVQLINAQQLARIVHNDLLLLADEARPEALADLVRRIPAEHVARELAADGVAPNEKHRIEHELHQHVEHVAASRDLATGHSLEIER